MTSKEALESILSYFNFDWYKHKNIYKCTNLIKQDLERLEKLEGFIEWLKNERDIVDRKLYAPYGVETKGTYTDIVELSTFDHILSKLEEVIGNEN